MKIFHLICILLFLIPEITKAQDTIIKRNDEKIISKIIEVNPTEIKYKLFNYQDGPSFILPKWELKNIVYQNGIKQIFDTIKPPAAKKEVISKKDLSIISSGKFYFFQSVKITELDMLEITKNTTDKRLIAANKKTREFRFARKACTTGAIVLGSFGLLTYAGIVSWNNSNGNTPMSGNPYGRRGRNSANITYRHTVGGYFMLAGLGAGIASVILSFEEVKHAHLTVKIYNKTIVE